LGITSSQGQAKTILLDFLFGVALTEAQSLLVDLILSLFRDSQITQTVTGHHPISQGVPILERFYSSSMFFLFSPLPPGFWARQEISAFN